MRASRLAGAAARLAAMAFTTSSLVSCGTQPEPSVAASGASGASAGLIAVVTGNDVNALVAIDVANHAVTRLVPIERNVAHLDVDGQVRAVPPLSVVLSDSVDSRPIVWTQGAGGAVAVRDLDPATNETHDINVPAPGVLPFLHEGTLAWASAPGDGQPRLLNSRGTFEVHLPGVPRFIVDGPGASRITVVVDVPDHQQRIVVVDLAKDEVTTLPTEFGLQFGGLWASDHSLVVSVPTRLVPTLDDPANGEPDKRLFTWTVEDGSSPTAAGGLAAGPTLTTDAYPTRVAGNDELIVAASGLFDRPWVEAVSLGSKDQVWRVELAPSGFVTAMTVSGTTVVVLQEGHVSFIDLSSGDTATVALDGVTETTWMGR